MNDNFEAMSDEELKAYINAPMIEAVKQRQSAPAQPLVSKVDPTLGMSSAELALAGFAKPFVDVGRGIKELGIMAGGTPQEIAQYNQEKARQREIDKQLMSNWPANLGALGGEVATSMVAPARVGPQMALAGAKSALSPTTTESKGLYGNLGARAIQGAEGALTTGAVAYPMGLLGRAAGAATQRYTPDGQKAMALDEAATRLGINRSIASLDPSSSSAAIERILPQYARTVEGQSKAFSEAARQTRDIPSKTGRSFESRVLEGEKLRQSIEEAGQNLTNVGASLWKDLDDYIVQNGLPPVTAKNSQRIVNDIIQNYTPITKKGMQLDKNPVVQRVAEYDPDAAQMLVQFLSSGSKAPQLPFSELHKVQTAVGKAMGRAEKDASAPGAALIDRQARTELKNLYGSLMSDVDQWGTKNPTAQKMYDDARNFWREAVVPGVLTNKVVSKASKGVYGANPRGYSEPSQLYSDVVSNPRAMQDLYPYMSQPGRDLTDTLSTMRDVARSLIGNKPHPSAPGMGLVTTLAGSAIGSPLQLMKLGITHLPGGRLFTESKPAKRLHFARDVLEDSPLGKVGYGMLQKPQGDLEGSIHDLWTNRK